jgi:hypothetical protein
MKINTQVATVTTNSTSANSDITTLSMDPKAIAHLMSIFNDLYSNTEAAVFREVLSNAIDSHVVANQTRPVQVSLPSAFSPNFVVKDYGTGMSAYVLKEIFAKYGASTKRKDNEQQGGFGLGGKAAFALTPQWTLYSISDGIKYTVLAYLNSEGVGELKIVSEVPTEEPNGVEVSIPIDNISRFVAAAPNILLGCDPKQVEVDGKPINNSIFNTEKWVDVNDKGWFNLEEFLARGRSLSGRPKVKIGSAIYDITENSVLSPWSNDIVARVGGVSIVAMDIGDVDLVPSRDDLKYSVRTVKAIQSAYAEFAAELNDKLNSIMQELNNRHDVLRFYYFANALGFTMDKEWRGEVMDVKIDNSDEKILVISTADKKKTATDIPRAIDVAHMATTTVGKPFFLAYETATEIHLASKNLKDYMKFHDKTEVKIIAAPADESVSVWMDGLTETVTVADIAADALEQRRRARRASAGSKAATGSSQMSYFTANLAAYNGAIDYQNRMVSKVNLSDISDDVYYLSEEKHNLYSLADSVKQSNNTFSFFKALYELGFVKGQVVIIPSNLSTDRFLKLRPNAIDLAPKVIAKMKKKVKALSKNERTFVYGGMNRKVHPVSHYADFLTKNKAVDKINNESTREVVILAADSNLRELKATFFSNMEINHLVNISELMEQAGINDVTSFASYPMLEKSYYNVRDFPIDHVVGYINLVDSL